MENVTKALLIAAGVLIGIIILSLAVYLSNIIGAHAAKIQEKIDSNAIIRFNEEFLKYNGLKNLTIQQVITLKNYALENNNEYFGYNWESDRATGVNDYIDVYLKGNIILGSNDEVLLKSEMNKKFKCTVDVSTITGRVYKVEFTEIPI